ncbi:TUL4 family lipoprotein, partial [Francisella tularensis subsp. holarctica]
MKKILIFTLMTATLAGCSKYNAFIDKLYDSDNSRKVNPDDNLDNPDQDGEVVSEDKPTATLKLKYNA